MRGIHPKSFILGAASGVVVLLLIAGGMHLLQPRRGVFGGPGGGNFQQGGAPNPARMAERLGMTEADLRKELDSGKTMQQIAEEHGVQLGGGFGRGPRGGTGAMMQSSASSPMSGSGNAMSVSSSSLAASSSSPSSSTR